MTVLAPGSVIPADVAAVLARLEPAIQQAFLAAIARIRTSIKLQDLIAAIEARNIVAAMDTLQLNPAYFGALDRAISEAHFQGGSMAEAVLKRLRLPGQGEVGLFGFNARHSRAEALARTQAGELIEGIIDDQRTAVRTFLAEGVERGAGPRSVALDIVGRMDQMTGQRTGGIIGLTASQTDYVIAARRELASGDPAQLRNYLSRQRRDARFDRLVRAALETGKPLSVADIDRITGRYKDRLLALRGETVARSEGITALRSGRHEGYVQLVESGKVRANQVIRKWRAAHDSRTRLSHLSLDKTEIRGLDVPFVAPDGSLLQFPGDRSLGASARECVNCRCTLDYMIDRRGKF